MNKQILDKICKRIEGSRDEIIALQKRLTALPALGPENGGEGEHKKAEYLEGYLRNTLKCDDVQLFKAPDDRVPAGFRPNLVARLRGKNSKRTVWVMSHMDVVPPGDVKEWHSDPWTVRVEGGKIYGRGTEDNQQGIVSSLIAARAFRDENASPEHNLGLILAADEETGSKYGIQYVLEHHRELFGDEGLIIIPDAGNAEGTMIEVAEKSIVWLKFRTLGKQTHASTPSKGINAHKAGAHLAVKLNNLYVMYNTSDALFDPPTSTFEPTKKEANVPNINTIPGEDVFYFDCRLLPNYDLDQFKKNVERIGQEIETRYRVQVEVAVEHEVRAASPTPPDAPVVQALQRAIHDLRGLEARPLGIGGGTVAAFFRHAGLSAAVWATQDDTLHGPNEYAKIENIVDDAKVFAHVALQA